jgi:hypothetical protein
VESRKLAYRAPLILEQASSDSRPQSCGGCKDPRDKIFGILTLINKREYQGLIPDYTLRDDEVFIQATKVMLTAYGGSLEPICSPCHGPKQNRSSSWTHGFTGHNKLPSWVRDFAEPTNKAISDADQWRTTSLRYVHHASSYTTPRLVSPKPTQLQLTGVFLGVLGAAEKPVRSWTKQAYLPVLKE